MQRLPLPEAEACRRLLAQNLAPIAIWMIRTPLRGSSDNRLNGARRGNVVQTAFSSRSPSSDPSEDQELIRQRVQ
jgi:hypothetical protein